MYYCSCVCYEFNRLVDLSVHFLFKEKFQLFSMHFLLSCWLVFKFKLWGTFFWGKFLFTCLCRLHSAGHLLDVCKKKVGLGHLEPGKGYHFPDGYVNFVVDSVRWVGL